MSEGRVEKGAGLRNCKKCNRVLCNRRMSAKLNGYTREKEDRTTENKMERHVPTIRKLLD